ASAGIADAVVGSRSASATTGRRSPEQDPHIDTRYTEPAQRCPTDVSRTRGGEPAIPSALRLLPAVGTAGRRSAGRRRDRSLAHGRRRPRRGPHPGTTRPLQPQAPRGRRRHPLRVLPHQRRILLVRRHPAAVDVHDVPLAALYQPTGVAAPGHRVPRRRAAALEAHLQVAGLRVFQSQHPRRQGRGLRELPRRGRHHAADPAGHATDHAVVPRLPSRSGPAAAAARRNIQHAVARPRPARPGQAPGAGLPHRHPAHDGLLAMSPLDRLALQVAQAARTVAPSQPPAFDADAARRRLSAARGPVFWRSLEELADDEGFRHWLRQQQPRLAETLSMDRRGFLKLLGASMALAGLAACSKPPQTEIVPFVHGQPGQVGGLPRFFATALPRRGYAQGVLVENHDGRPTKVEGNPQHPASLGATDIYAQAAILQLWDPDRSQVVMHGNTVATWDDFQAVLLATT